MTITNTEALRSRYLQVRQASRALNKRLVGRLSKDILDEGARKLGMLQDGTLIFNSEDGAAVLMDYCIYGVRRKGRNVVEQYLIDSPPDDDSLELTVLRAMQNAFYSVFVVESVEEGLGVRLRDFRTAESVLVVDFSFADTATPNAVLAARLLPFEEFSITSGAPLALGVPSQAMDELQQGFRELLHVGEQGDFDPAPLLNAFLELDTSSNIEYAEPRTGESRSDSTTKVGRNQLCPCGSGKKFKRCCMKR